MIGGLHMGSRRNGVTARIDIARTGWGLARLSPLHSLFSFVDGI